MRAAFQISYARGIGLQSDQSKVSVIVGIEVSLTKDSADNNPRLTPKANPTTIG